MWTREHLKQTIQQKMSDYMLVIVSNRQPYSHVQKGGKLVCQRQPGGVVTALDPVMQAAGGLWVAAGTSAYDRKSADAMGKVMIPPENPAYTLRRIFLTKEETDAYYYGYCNQGLWPLSHIAYTRPVFPIANWQAYEQVNRKFAQAILEEVGDKKAFVWVQDFHLVLIAKYLQEAGRSNIITSLFWHIPWPNPEIFSICPQKNQILEGLLAYDLLGFQIKYHGDNFMSTVDRELESRIDRENDSVVYQNHSTFVRPFPISVDFGSISTHAGSVAFTDTSQRLREDYGLGNAKLLVSVDRIDYTKGLLEKIYAVDRFLEKYPEYREKFVFFQLGQISRIHVPRYKELNDEINAAVEQINWKHSQGAWTPIVLSRSYMSYQDILMLYRSADVCLVGSVHDGMNLVAKEFVAARPDNQGVLILSRFTGAARELIDAVQINPYDIENAADAIYQAFEMTAEEQEKRMRKMREAVANQNIYRWAGKVLSQLLKFEFQEV